jgi:hypothetical protein
MEAAMYFLCRPISSAEVIQGSVLICSWKNREVHGTMCGGVPDLLGLLRQQRQQQTLQHNKTNKTHKHQHQQQLQYQTHTVTYHDNQSNRTIITQTNS